MPKNLESRMKRTKYKRIKGYQGICTIWDLNPDTLEYEKRSSGLRFYAFKRVDGKQYSKCFASFKEASDWRSSPFIFAEKINTDATFREVMGRFFEKKREGGKLCVTTLETYESSAKHLAFFNDLPMSQVNTPAIDQWLKFVKHPGYLATQHRTRISYRHELSVLRQILVYYAEYECDAYQVPLKKRHNEDCIVDFEKVKQRKQDSKGKFIPREDLLRFLEALSVVSRQKAEHQAVYLIGFFQVWTGVRIGEAAAVRVEDFDFTRSVVRIWQTVHWSRSKERKTRISPLTKTGEQREVPIPAFLMSVVREWLNSLARFKGLVFSEDGKEPIGYRSIQYRYDRAFKLADLAWRSTHILRHSFATDFLEKTGDKVALQGILGHASPKQTDHYAKITNATIGRGMKTYETSLDERAATVLPFPFKRPDDPVNECESAPDQETPDADKSFH